MQDYQALANALIEAFRGATNAGVQQLDLQKRNYFEDINNRAAKRGTLYSTGGGAQRARYVGTEYLPKKAQIEQGGLMNEVKVKSDLLDTQRKIDALNKAASQLNGIDDAYFKSLLV